MTFNISPETVLNMLTIVTDITVVLCILVIVIVIGIILLFSICFPIYLTTSLVEELYLSYHRGFRSLEHISFLTVILVLSIILYYLYLYDLYQILIDLQPSAPAKQTGWFQTLFDYIYD